MYKMKFMSVFSLILCLMLNSLTNSGVFGSDVKSTPVPSDCMLDNILRLERAVNNMSWELKLTKTELENTKLELENIKTDPVNIKSGAGGAVFTRWGRKDCPSDTEQVYTGYAGGSSYKEMGGSAQLVCLPDQPIYEETTDGVQGFSYIYATEYESGQSQPDVRRLDDHDMPCAVCLKRQHKTTLMVPARNVCYSGWTIQYKGYLWGGPVDRSNLEYAPKDYICVDQNAESVQGLGRHPGGLPKVSMYVVEGRCNNQAPLCPAGYQDGWELTCAVCTL